MAKKKNSPKNSMQNEMQKLFDHIRDQGFENQDDLQAFLNQMIGKNLGEIIPQKKGPLSKKEQSQELVYEAYESSPAKGKKLIDKALKLDPNNVAAFNYLGNIQEDAHKAADYYKRGMLAGMKEIGLEGFEEMKGHFWGFHETRPFMEAKSGYAECLYVMGKYEESANEFREMIELNPNDNQGVRYKLAAILLQLRKVEEYEELFQRFGEEASAMWLFTHAIYWFIKEGVSDKSKVALLNAHEENKHVIPFMIGEKEFPEFMPDYYSMGDESEALIYLQETVMLWAETPGAIDWLKMFFEEY